MSLHQTSGFDSTETKVSINWRCLEQFQWAQKDEISDEKHEEIFSSSDRLFDKNPKVFELQLFLSNSLKDLVPISSVVHRSLRDQFVSLIVTEERV